MIYRNKRSAYQNFVLIFVGIKVLFNLLAISNFGFHRDELLHLALADHLDWGYKEVPPFIAFLAKISLSVFGDSVFASRILTTIASGFIVWLTGQITIELGGRKFAIALACLALIFSPAFAASGYLFQPVVFDQLWWVLSAYFIVKYVNTVSVAYLYAFGATVGVGMLTKYTMAFFAIALLVAVLISKQRRILFSWHILGAGAVALLLFLPNLIWQWTHHFPVMQHMKELRETQLDYIPPTEFIAQQIMVNGVALFVWLTGFLFLLFSFKLRKFQFLAIAYIIIFLFLLKMNGKNYYLFGAYPMLFAAGACAFDRLLKTGGQPLRAAVVALFVLPNIILLPVVLPILPVKNTLAFFDYTKRNLPFLSFTTRWEDQQQHATTQDYADMFGWDEMANLAQKAYNSLSHEARKEACIYADNYGQAGALNLYGKRMNLPGVVCLNSSFALWAPEQMSARYLIYITDDREDVAKLTPLFGKASLIGSVQNPLAREKGTMVYLFAHPTPAIGGLYKKSLAETRTP